MSRDPDRGDSNGRLSELLNVTIPADTTEVAIAADAIDAVLADLQMPEQRRMEIGLAVQEALINAVVHGCNNDRSKSIQCRMQTDPRGRIVIIVTDPGLGFNPDQIADPKKSDNLLTDHGRGVYLIRQLMDEVHFEQNGTQVKMWKY
jgi:serine/threonine-protein kinase RsbW